MCNDRCKLKKKQQEKIPSNRLNLTAISAVDACVPKIKLGGAKKTWWMNSTV
jgi:hypothetical protein